jgi:CRP/FNR family cyclic AMP-dependent transcriptional regulator
MYPHVTQFETRSQEVDRRYGLFRAFDESRAGRPAPAALAGEKRRLWLGSSAWLGLLPRRERRTLARVTEIVDVPAGRRLLRQGGPADEFFVIQRGRADVIRDGEPVARLGPGDFFGELAILRGGTRTASVVATTRMRIRVVPRRQFAGLLRMLPTLARVVRTAEAVR